MIYHTQGHFIGDDGRDGIGIHRAGNGDHVQSDRADASHGLEFFQTEGAFAHRLGQNRILHHWNKGAAQATHGLTGKDATLLHRIIEQGKDSRGTGGSNGIDPEDLKNLPDAVADSGCGGERQINDAEFDTECF